MSANIGSCCSPPTPLPNPASFPHPHLLISKEAVKSNCDSDVHFRAGWIYYSLCKKQKEVCCTFGLLASEQLYHAGFLKVILQKYFANSLY